MTQTLTIDAKALTHVVTSLAKLRDLHNELITIQVFHLKVMWK